MWFVAPTYVPLTSALSKDNEPVCTKHKSASCSRCFGFKKQLVKLNKDAVKSSTRAPSKSTNLY